MTDINKTGLNDREVSVKYPTFDRLIERLEYITNSLKEDLDAMGNEQYISTIKVVNDDITNTYRITFVLKPTDNGNN